MPTTPSNGPATTSARRPKAVTPPPPITTIAEDLDLHTLELDTLIRIQYSIRYQDFPLAAEEEGWLGGLIQRRLGELATNLRRDAQACVRHAKG